MHDWYVRYIAWGCDAHAAVDSVGDPTLARMEARDYVVSEWEEAGDAKAADRPRRRYCRVTAVGALALSEALDRLTVLSGAAPRTAAQG